jgi:hypothetical protein
MLRQLLAKLSPSKEQRRLKELRKNLHKPRLLPVGLTDYQELCDDVILLTGEFADRDSMIYAISGVIINLKHDVDAIPMDYLVRCLRKTAVNQVASYEFQRISQEHAKKKAEEQAQQKQAEATASANAVANANP